MGREGKLLDQASFGLSQDPGTVPPSKRGSFGAGSTIESPSVARLDQHSFEQLKSHH